MALVKMYHTDTAVTGGPTVADVPEEAVHDWERNGWSPMPFDVEPKKGATRKMYRQEYDYGGTFTAEVPESMVHQLESEGWSTYAF